MIGLMFLGVIGLWILLAIYLAGKLPSWFGVSSNWQRIGSFALMPPLIFLPVIDEVGAIPQALALCKQAEDAFWYDRTAQKALVKKSVSLETTYIEIFSGIQAKKSIFEKRLVTNDKPGISWVEITFSSRFFGFPAGSSGNKIPLLLPEICPSRAVQWPRIDEAKKELQLISEN